MIKKPPVESEKPRRIRLALTGFTMGMADLVPGVSGGTIAFLFGIYDELLYSIKVITGQFPRLLLKGRFGEAWRVVPFGFLVPLFLGIGLAIFGLVGVFSYLLEHYPVYLWSLFFGLVLGSSYIVSKRVAGWNIRRFGLLVLGFAATYGLVGLPTLNGVSPSAFVMFATGAIAICAMILPGISGSLIMVMLGQYENVINAVADRSFHLLAPFAAGAVVGIAIFSRLLSWLLKNFHSAVIAFLIGVMLGSLRKVWPWQIEVEEKIFTNTLPSLSWQLAASLVLMLAGFLLVWQLERMGIAKEHDDIDSKAFAKEIKAQHD